MKFKLATLLFIIASISFAQEPLDQLQINLHGNFNHRMRSTWDRKHIHFDGTNWVGNLQPMQMPASIKAIQDASNYSVHKEGRMLPDGSQYQNPDRTFVSQTFPIYTGVNREGARNQNGTNPEGWDVVEWAQFRRMNSSNPEILGNNEAYQWFISPRINKIGWMNQKYAADGTPLPSQETDYTIWLIYDQAPPGNGAPNAIHFGSVVSQINYVSFGAKKIKVWGNGKIELGPKLIHFPNGTYAGLTGDTLLMGFDNIVVSDAVKTNSEGKKFLKVNTSVTSTYYVPMLTAAEAGITE